MLWSCDKDKNDADNGVGVITMVVEVNEIRYGYVYSFNEGEFITIDWGDGTKGEFQTIEKYDTFDKELYYAHELKHSYPNSDKHTITIKGNIKKLYCHSSGLTALNVSRCTTLKELECSNNDLTELDVSRCTELTRLECNFNNLSSLDVSKCMKLTFLFCFENKLSSLSISESREWIQLDCADNNLSANALNKIFNDLPAKNAYIQIYHNSGSHICDTSIAKDKGWRVSI